MNINLLLPSVGSKIYCEIEKGKSGSENQEDLPSVVFQGRV